MLIRSSNSSFSLVVFLTVLCFFPAAALAAPELDKFFQEIQAASAQVQSFSSEFVQERRLALFTDPVIFHGKLTVIRPDRLRWEFTAPVPSALIFDGKKGIRCNDKAPPAHFDLGTDPVMRTRPDLGAVQTRATSWPTSGCWSSTPTNGVPV